MSIKPIELLDFAKSLSQSSDNEVALRDCVNKSYYCAYHTVKSTLPDLPNYFGGTHKTLIEYLKMPPPEIKCSDTLKLYKRIGYSLLAQKDMRVKADYYLHDRVGPSEAQNAIEAAERILDICMKIPQTEVGKKPA